MQTEATGEAGFSPGLGDTRALTRAGLSSGLYKPGLQMRLPGTSGQHPQGMSAW